MWFVRAVLWILFSIPIWKSINYPHLQIITVSISLVKCSWTGLQIRRNFIKFLFNAKSCLTAHTHALCMYVCVCVLCMPVCLLAYLSVCDWIKEYSVFPYCRLPPLLLLWPSIVSCLETDRKESAVQPFIYLPLSPPPCFHPSIIHPPLFTSISRTLYPLVSVGLCFFSPQISNMLSLSSSIHSTESSSHTMLVVSG